MQYWNWPKSPLPEVRKEEQFSSSDWSLPICAWAREAARNLAKRNQPVRRRMAIKTVSMRRSLVLKLKRRRFLDSLG